MNATMIGTNIKKLRDEHNVTQQQLADAIGISFQAVSKWECNTTIPDVTILPVLSDFFGVTIDELFKENMNIYKNKAHRLTALYESDTQNSEAFEKADKEYNKLFADGDYDDQDLGSYAYLNDCRMTYYMKKADDFYLKAIEKGKDLKCDSYYKSQRQYIRFLSKISRAQESVIRHKEILKKDPNNPMNFSSLVAAYMCTGEYENAYQIAEKGLSMFPDDAILLVFAGDTCKKLGRYEEAEDHWDKAFLLDPEMIDTRYSLAFCLIEQGQKEKAKTILEQIIDWNNQRGFTIENKWVQTELNKLAE